MNAPWTGPVAVEVTHRGQHRAGALGGGQEGGLQRRPVGEPLVVRRAGAVVQGRGALGEFSEPLGAGYVGGDEFDFAVPRASAPAGDQPDVVAALRKQQRGGGPDRPGPDDDVLRHVT